MRKLYHLFCVVLLLPCVLGAQLTLTSDYFPAEGDTLRTAIDNLPPQLDLLGTSGPHSWDFTTLQSPFNRVRVVAAAETGASAAAFPAANLLLPQADGADGYYRSTDEKFEIIGYDGEAPFGPGLRVVAPFKPPYVERWAPLALFDVNSTEAALTFAAATDSLPDEIFDMLPVTPDSIRIRIQTSRLDIVDAFGTLKIPGGVYNVLREKRTEFRNVRIDVRVGPFPWADVTDLLTGSLPVDGLGRDTLVNYYFWSDEVKEAVAVVRTDAATDSIRQVEYKSNDAVSSLRDLTDRRPAVFAYPNPAIVTVRFEFANLPAGPYQLAFYDLLGRERLRQPLQLTGNEVHRVDVSSLDRGVYLYSLLDRQGRVVTTRRLLISGF